MNIQINSLTSIELIGVIGKKYALLTYRTPTRYLAWTLHEIT